MSFKIITNNQTVTLDMQIDKLNDYSIIGNNVFAYIS